MVNAVDRDACGSEQRLVPVLPSSTSMRRPRGCYLNLHQYAHDKKHVVVL